MCDVMRQIRARILLSTQICHPKLRLICVLQLCVSMLVVVAATSIVKLSEKKCLTVKFYQGGGGFRMVIIPKMSFGLMS